MTGGLVQIITYGTQDIFLTGNPEISFFKIVYRRHTNFSIDTVEQFFDGNINFGEQIQCNILPDGDLVHKMILKIDLPDVDIQIPLTSTDIANLAVLLSDKTTAWDGQDNFKSYADYVLAGYIAIYNNYQVATSTSTSINSTIITYFSQIDYEDYTTIKQNIDFSYITDLSLQQQVSQWNTQTDIRTQMLQILNDTSLTAAQQKEKMFIANENVKYHLIRIHKVLYDVYLTALDAYNELNNTNIKFAWIQKLGYFIMDYVDVEIGGQRIDRHYNDWLHIWNELSRNPFKDITSNKMIGNVDSLITYSKDEKGAYSLYIPLQFWFCRNNGLALPIVAMRYSQIVIKVKFNELENCCFYNYDNSNNDLQNYISLSNASLLVDYIYLDRDERTKFAQSSHEYLIEQVQRDEYNNITTREKTFELTFVHPCKEFIWVAQKNSDVETNKLYSSYSVDLPGHTNSYNPIDTCNIQLNGLNRTPKETFIFYNYVQPYTHHSSTPILGINVYSFALIPEELQPSGSCNMTQLQHVTLQVNFLQELIDEIILDDDYINFKIFATNYNVLRISKGMAGLAFA